MKLVPIVAMIAIASSAFAGTDTPPGQGGEVCQGSTCNGDDNGSDGNTFSNIGNSSNVLTSSFNNVVSSKVDNNVTSKSTSQSNSAAIAGSNSTSSSIATGGSGGAGGAGGTGGSSSVSNTVHVSNSTPSAPRNSRIETVGIAPDITSYSTAPCRVAIGASGGWLGGAFGFTGSVLDEGCDIWRDHVNLTSSGYKGAADMRLCDKPELKKLLPFCATIGDTKEANSYTAGFRH
jgi:hypothetical protein